MPHLPELPNYSPKPTLSPHQHHVLALLADGRSLQDAANQIGIHRNTISNWRRTIPAFAQELEFALLEQSTVWHEQAIQFAPRAAQVLEEILNDPATRPGLRLTAALAILKMAANPQPKPLVPFAATTAEAHAFDAQRTAVAPPPVVPVHNPESCTIVHNAKPSLPFDG